jgi:hypothetical protein
MTVQEQLHELLSTMPEEDRRFVVEFARFLSLRKEHDEWQRFGLAQFARSFSDDEPEYAEADLKSELSR